MATPGQVIGVGKLITPGGKQGPKGDAGTAVPLADVTQNGLLRQISGLTTDFVDGSNHCQNLQPLLRQYNSIRNPTMRMAQRGLGPTTASGIGIDGWTTGGVGPASTYSRIAAAIPPDASGNKWYPYTAYAQRITITTAKTSLAAGDYLYAGYQAVEGLLAEPLKGVPTSISLLVRASIPGTFSVNIQDAGSTTYMYTMAATIPVANVWTRIALPNIPAFPSAGSFPDGNVLCYYLEISLAGGSSYINPTLNTWGATQGFVAPTQTNFAATVGNTFDFTLVKHEPNPICTPFIGRSVEDEVSINYRYLWYPGGNFGYLGWMANAQWTYEMGRITMPVPMRAAPTIMAGSVFFVSSGNAGTPVLAYSNPGSVVLYNSSANWIGSTGWAGFNGGFTAEL